MSGNIRSKTSSLKRPTSTTRKSTSKISNNLENIEAEYIKNLQQQIYYLELEANYLREQTKKAKEVQPIMSLEAEKMQSQMRSLQTELDNLNLEVRRKQANVDLVESEKKRLMERLHTNEGSFGSEKKRLVDESIDLRHRIECIQRENESKELELLKLKDHLEKNLATISQQDAKIFHLDHELIRKNDEIKALQLVANDNRNDATKAQGELRNLEQEYYSNTQKLQEELTRDLRDEIRVLRQQLKEAEVKGDQDRYFKTKLQDDTTGLARENAKLTNRVEEIERMLEKERSLRQTSENRFTVNNQELTRLKTNEQHLEWELKQARDLLESERERVRTLSDRVTERESELNVSKLNAMSTTKTLTELSSEHNHVEADNINLRKDKKLLVDHVSELLDKLEKSETENKRLIDIVLNLEKRLELADDRNAAEASLQSMRWDDLGKVAENMKDLSQSMSMLSRSSKYPYSIK